MIECIICKRVPDSTQPTYCLYCHIHIPQVRKGKYKGTTKVRCNNCQANLGIIRQNKCNNCGVNFSAKTPPITTNEDTETEYREKNRQALAKQILSDKKMHEQIIGMLGLDRLSKVEQGVSLSAIAREKMHPLSGEYNFNESHTLIDMAYGICTEMGEKWAIELVKFRLGLYYLREGREMLATTLFQEVLLTISQEGEVNFLRYLEIKSYLALAHRLAGNDNVATEITKDAYNQLADYFEELQPKIDIYLEKNTKISEYMGPLEDGGTFPRVDMISSILSVLVEEAMARGDSDEKNADDEVLHRLLELDNALSLLEKMSPQDDPGFFASYLREFVRLFSAIFWYPDFLVYNDDLKRQVLIEQAFKRFQGWMELIPVEYWLQLRPARLIEIFHRASIWNENIDKNYFIDQFLSRSNSFSKPSFLYVIADAYTNLQRYEDALIMINELLSMDKVKETLIVLAEKLKLSIQLENTGILTGVELQEPRIIFPISVQLDQISSNYEPESYMKEMIDKTSPVLRLNFEYDEISKLGLAIFGDRLKQVAPKVEQRIFSVGDEKFNSYSWEYGQQLMAWGIGDPSELNIQGFRMEVLIIQMVVRNEPVYLLFEGQMQKMERIDKDLILHPSELLVLRGIIEHIDLEQPELLEIITQVMSGDEEFWENTHIYSLKSTEVTI